MEGAVPQGVIAILHQVGIATGIAQSTPIYAVVSASHVLGIALLVGPIMLADLRLMGFLPGLGAEAFGILRRAAAWGVALSVLTGLLLLTARPTEYAANPILLAKLGVVAVAIVHALAVERRWRRIQGAGMAKTPQAAATGALSLALWLAALLLGRWIAFI
jgi:hypothetical protein